MPGASVTKQLSTPSTPCVLHAANPFRPILPQALRAQRVEVVGSVSTAQNPLNLMKAADFSAALRFGALQGPCGLTQVTTICLRTPKELNHNNPYVALNKEEYLCFCSGFLGN